MKKPYRTLTVADVEYNWIVNFNNDGDGGTFLRIFTADKKQIYNNQVLHHKLPVTPKLVSDIIYEIMFGCEEHHDIVPILGYENSMIGEECRQCGIQFNNSGQIINRKDEINGKSN